MTDIFLAIWLCGCVPAIVLVGIATMDMDSDWTVPELIAAVVLWPLCTAVVVVRGALRLLKR